MILWQDGHFVSGADGIRGYALDRMQELMAIETNSQEFQILLRQFEKGNVALFAGAGFSIGAQNSLGTHPPLGPELARILAKECGWSYNDEDLPSVYEQAQRHLGSKGLQDVLVRHYRDCKPSDWHLRVSSLQWYRIYTTNIDDVLEQAYKGPAAQRLDLITCPTSYEDPDLWYDRVQSVHLHGSVLDPAKGYTFTLEDFAGQTAVPSPWYQALADDMMTRAFLFVGTRLTESPFYHYLSLRGQRSRGAQEVRAKAFVVSPNVSTIRRRQLEDSGFAVFDATAEEFFGVLLPLVSGLVPDRITLLKNRYPHQLAAISQGLLSQQSELLRQFDFVTPIPPASAAGRTRSLFFEGAEPTWEDIAAGLDASREATGDFLTQITGAANNVNSILLVGHAGSGKSTLLKRLAVELSRAGNSVYFMKSPERLEMSPITNFLNSVRTKRTFFFFDEAVAHIGTLETLVARHPDWTVTFVLAGRPHVILPRLPALAHLKPTVLEMPSLTRTDSESIIRKLTEFGRLGKLQGKTWINQLREFLSRSKKQLLVAMKEATSGDGFDVILANEFFSLASDGARLIYAITCIAYMHGAPVRRRHLLACLDGSDIDKATILANHLQGVVVSWREGSDYLCPRHRVIAQQVATESSPPEVRREAVASILIQLSPDITPLNISRRTPEYIAYRGLINLDNMIQLFGEDYDTISEIYEDVKAYYGDQFLFWLQFGRAELYFDHFSLAENYLNQSLGIRDARNGNYQALHHIAVLYLKRALAADDLVQAQEDVRNGSEILLDQIRERGHLDTYPYEALATHKLRWLVKRQGPHLKDELESLVAIAKAGHDKHPYDDRMRDAYQKVYREYLMLAVRRGETAVSDAAKQYFEASGGT
jgi:energy-coupling factor transporter ATP-binding protein EcfA2